MRDCQGSWQKRPPVVLPQLYWRVKPLIPRRIQVGIRQKWASIVRRWRANGWPIDEKAAKLPSAWSGWPQGKKFALVLTHDVETAVGQQRCPRLAEIEQEFGFRSCWLFVPERYAVSADLRQYLSANGFEIGVHGLRHDGRLFSSRGEFERRAEKVNMYLRDWQAVGFRSPCAYRNLEWIGDLQIEYDCSTFDTDPYEPQPEGMGTIFPFWVPHGGIGTNGYVELPYTIPQDWTVFILLREKAIGLWKRKLDWICEKGGMALAVVHPDYLYFDKRQSRYDNYPAKYYTEFLEYIKSRYEGQYWHALPRDVARFWARRYGSTVCPPADVPEPHPAAQIVGADRHAWQE